MSKVDLDAFLPPRLRVMQIIVLALTVGPLIFLAVVVVQKLSGTGPQWDESATPLVTYVCYGFALLQLILNGVVPAMIVSGGLRRIARNQPFLGQPPATDPAGATDVGRLCQLYQTQMIVGAAFLEGAAFFAVIAYMMENQPLSKYLALVLIAGVAMKFPTRPRLERWLVEQEELVRRERAAPT